MTITITFRTTDNGKWGVGAGTNLTPEEVDNNFWNLKVAVEQLQEDLPEAAAQIESFSVQGNQFYVTMSDNNTFGPYDLPVATWTFVGAWQASSSYLANQVVTNSYSTYLVKVAHTSGTTFDPNATDGQGNALYGLIFTSPVPAPKHQVIAGSAPGDKAISGIKLGDRIDEVLYVPAIFDIVDLTSEFTITATDNINNTLGTDTTGGKLIVRWTSL